jgi:hypothetical protein
MLLLPQSRRPSRSNVTYKPGTLSKASNSSASVTLIVVIEESDLGVASKWIMTLHETLW